MKARLALKVISLSAVFASTLQAMEIQVSVAGCAPGPWCGWSIQVKPDRTATVLVLPDEHLSRKFVLSRAQFAEVRKVLAQEDFFSLPERVGRRVPDGPLAQIEVTDGSKNRYILIDPIPEALLPIWRTDPSPVGRAIRICEHLRLLTGLEQPLRCPGLPAESKSAR